MSERIRGRVWKFGDDVDTDAMAPMATLTGTWDQRFASMFPRRRGFSGQVRPGDIIVAGRNWGCGSSREHAPENLKKLGLGAIVAESFGRIFFRNCVAIALPALACPGVTAHCEEGDEIEVELGAGRVTIHRTGVEVVGPGYTVEMLNILDKGGLMNVLKEEVRPSS